MLERLRSAGATMISDERVKGEPVAIDYSPFLHVLEDGTIWWQLTDAVKLGAGYLPLRDDDRDLNPVLRAKSNRVRANERTLFSEFSPDHYTHAHPRLLERDGGRLVEATEFLDWLFRHLATQTQSTIGFPGDLATEVRKAKGAADLQASVPPRFDSVTIALEGWFDRPLAELPAALRQRVEREMSPIPWDHMAAVQRRTVALQLDYQHDPATEQGRKFWWDFFQRMDGLKKQIAQWDATATPTASELALKEARLKELRQELARIDTQKRQDRGDYYPERNQLVGECKTPTPSTNLPFQYVAYPKAMRQMTKRLGATPAELAAWVWMGQTDGGLAAYMNANELDPPPRFYYAVGGDSHDYIAPLMACWFRAVDIDQFEPAERYITGAALIERWGTQPGLQAAAFIQAKIAESRLLDIHPIYGGTRVTFSEHPDWPPLESGLFPLSHVEQIEAEDFDVEIDSDTTNQPDLGSSEWRKQTAQAAANARHDQPGGSRDKQRQIREIWSSGKYTSRDVCAEEECAALAMSFSSARRALTNEPEPSRC